MHSNIILSIFILLLFMRIITLFLYFFLSNNDETNMDNWTFYSFSTFIIPIDDRIKWFEWFISGYFDILLFDWWYSHYHTYYHFVVILANLYSAVGTMLIISQQNLLWMDHSIQWLSGYSNTIHGSWISYSIYNIDYYIELDSTQLKKCVSVFIQQKLNLCFIVSLFQWMITFQLSIYLKCLYYCWYATLECHLA